MRSVYVITLVLLVPLAATSLAASGATDLDLTDCQYLESLNQVPGALVDPFIPDGDFAVAAITNLVVGMAQCTATTSDGRSGPVTFGWADVGVVPRSGLRSHDQALYLFRIEHLTMDDLYGEAHAAFGTECRVLDSSSVVASTLDNHAIGVDDGVTAWDIRVPVGLPPTGTPGPGTHYREFGRAVGGYAYLEGDLVGPGVTSLAGTFLVDPASPLFGIWGPAWVSRIQAAPGFAITDTHIDFIADATSPMPTETC